MQPISHFGKVIRSFTEMKLRLLILKCSSRKRADQQLLPAIERYDGPMWQVLRRYLQEFPGASSDLVVYGLSAEFGLFPATETIPWYERTIDLHRAQELHPQVMERLHMLVSSGYEKMCLGVSQRYLHALQGWEIMIPGSIQVTVTDGTAGVKLGQLRAWLHGTTWASAASHQGRIIAPLNPRGKARIGGVTLDVTHEEALHRARVALASNGARAAQYRTWYVIIDDHPVSAKWLVSMLSGLPTNAFEASRARDVLLALGFDIEHT